MVTRWPCSEGNFLENLFLICSAVCHLFTIHANRCKESVDWMQRAIDMSGQNSSRLMHMIAKKKIMEEALENQYKDAQQRYEFHQILLEFDC